MMTNNLSPDHDQAAPAKRLGRPPRRDGLAATRERILMAAIGRFAERGYDGSSLRDIAAAADLTEGAIYRHYDSKEAILEAVLAEFERRVYQPVPPVGGGEAEGFVHGLLAGLPRVILGDPVLLQCARFLLGEAQRNPRIRDFVLSRFVDGAEAHTAAMIRGGLPDPQGLPLGPELLARTLNALRFGWVFGMLILRQPGDLAPLEAELAAIAGFLDRAIAARPSKNGGTQ
jgi:AcrR family transcriptional regulator